VVPTITAFFFEKGGSDDPWQLKANSGRSFEGVKPYGQGFIFDDSDPKANPTDLMQRLLASDPRNRQVIFPYISGEEVNDSPTHSATRFIINFGQRELEECRAWPEILNIVETRVKSERATKSSEVADRPWWQFFRVRAELASATRMLPRVLVLSRHGNQLAFAFLPSGIVASEALVVFPLPDFASFATLQARSHEIWARFFASSIKDDVRYTPSDCFETFPFPAGFETNAALEAAGREYYEFRAALMQDLWLGLTEIYNLFHSPDDEALARLEALYRKRAATSDWRAAESVPADRSPLTLYATPAAALTAVQHLRTLHAAMDTAVLTAYGWTDLLPKCTCEFLLDYEDESDAGLANGAEESSGRKKKKPWRYRWPDEVRDEVLARLLKLNAERAEEERLAGGAIAKDGKGQAKTKRSPKKSLAGPAQGDLLPPPQGDFFG
jgi:hypothetical protein